jgi:hypothetical protein
MENLEENETLRNPEAEGFCCANQQQSRHG